MVTILHLATHSYVDNCIIVSYSKTILNHSNNVNFLKILFRFVAFEPFCNTLATWMKQNIAIDIDIAKEILSQITKGLEHCHQNDLIHGNLTERHIVIYSDTNTGKPTVVKISKFFANGK